MEEQVLFLRIFSQQKKGVIAALLGFKPDVGIKNNNGFLNHFKEITKVNRIHSSRYCKCKWIH
jgi:hypothetical protein